MKCMVCRGHVRKDPDVIGRPAVYCGDECRRARERQLARAVRDLGKGRFNGDPEAQLADAETLYTYWFPPPNGDDWLLLKHWGGERPPKPHDPPSDPSRVRRALVERVKKLRAAARDAERKRRKDEAHRAQQATADGQARQVAAAKQADADVLAELAAGKDVRVP